MKTPHRFARPVKYFVVASIITMAMALYLPEAQATLVGIETRAQTAETPQERDRLHDALDREEAKAKLLSLGVEPAQAQARIDALTDEEAQALVKNLDALPAGGDTNTITILLIIILLVILL